MADRFKTGGIMSGIEGSGIVNPLDLGPHNPADQVTLNKLAIPAPHEVAPVTGERKPGEEPQRRDQRPAGPAPKRPTTTTTSDRAADVPPGAQVLVALDEALVRQAESEMKPEIPLVIGEYTQLSRAENVPALSIEA